MMSDPSSEGTLPNYETLLSNSLTTVPVANVPVASFFQNVNPSLPIYSTSSNQQWSVPTVAPQWHLAAVIPRIMDQSAPFFQTFLKGKPKALGIVVICASILEIALGIALAFTRFNITLPSGVTFWGPVFYIIAGSLTIAAQTKPNTCLIRGSLGLNIISSIFSMVAIILNAIDLGISYCYNYSYDYNYGGYYQQNCRQLLNGSYAVLSLLLVINLLLFSITISTSIYGCKSLSKVENVTQVFVMQNATNPSITPVTVPYSQPAPQPPPYAVNDVKPYPTQ